MLYAERESDNKEYFVANQNSEFFHKPGCKWTRIIKEDSIVVFKSVSEVEEKRFKPRRYCKPKPEIKYGTRSRPFETKRSHNLRPVSEMLLI